GDNALTQAVADRAAAVTAAEMLGMAESAFGQTLDYLKQRMQFGQLLSTFQALQHRMAKMLTELELMRSAVEGALEAIDAGRSDVDQAVSLAKAVANDTLRLVSRETVQLHGGVGMTDEFDAGLYLKRAAVLETMWGNASWHRDRFGRLNGY
ncbi:MAG: acyl-CoA dehydrogenase, partial [Proteobacteria bacterium]|nr:acyl-CoA dehydrogenase [Pseudomonadota bacterium]